MDRRPKAGHRAGGSVRVGDFRFRADEITRSERAPWLSPDRTWVKVSDAGEAAFRNQQASERP